MTHLHITKNTFYKSKNTKNVPIGLQYTHIYVIVGFHVLQNVVFLSTVEFF